MADTRPLRVAREAGLTAEPRRAGGRQAGASRVPRAELAAHRERRMRMGSYLLGASLVLGVAWMGLFVATVFPQTGVPSTVYGIVRDSATNAPIPNATVEVEGLNLTNMTDSTGNFTILNVPSGGIRLRIVAADHKDTTFAVYIAPAAGGGRSPYNGYQLLLEPGSGSVFVDDIASRNLYAGTCLTIFAVGLVLNAVGFLATRTRRRYGHAALGSVGAFLSIGFYIGPLLGLIAYMLLRGARDAFADRRALFSPGGGPALYDEGEEEEEAEEEDEDEPEEDHEDQGEAGEQEAGADEGAAKGEKDEPGDRAATTDGPAPAAPTTQGQEGQR